MNKLIVALPRAKAAYVAIPKVANTSIKHFVLAMQGIARSSHIHKPSAGHVILSPYTLRQMMPDVFTFTFVRNPYDRLVSCYYSKVAGAEKLSLPFRRLGFAPSMSFAEFAGLCAAIPDDQADIHFRCQHRFVRWQDWMMPHFIGRYESFAQDWAVVSAVLAARSGGPVPPLPTSNRTSGDKKQRAPALYDEGLADLVYTRYRADIRLFGYKKEPPAALRAYGITRTDGPTLRVRMAEAA